MTTTPRCFGCMEPATADLPCSCGFTLERGAPGIALTPGRWITPRYQVGRLLGDPGGFGITYLGHDAQLARKVAVKEFLPRLVAGRAPDATTVRAHTTRDAAILRDGLRRFLDEARMLARFDHEHIVGVQDFFEANGTAYLVMPYLPGRTVAAHLRAAGGRLPAASALAIVLPVLDALDVVHGGGLLHRDVKPQNVYLTDQHRVLLLDFGAARATVSMQSGQPTAVLSEGFAPPEQYGSGAQGPWTDVYGCGATLFQLLAGQVPPPATARRADDPLRDPRDPATSQLPPALRPAVLHALALDARDRPASATAWRDELLAAMAATVPVTPATTRLLASGMVPALRRRRLALAAGIVSAGLLAFVIRPSGDTSQAVVPPPDLPPVVDTMPVEPPPPPTLAEPLLDEPDDPPPPRRSRARRQPPPRPHLGHGETFLSTPLGHYYRHLDDRGS